MTVNLETASAALEAVFAAVPFLVLLAAYRRTRNPRLALAAAAFLVFLLRGVILLAVGRDDGLGEVVELIGSAIGLGLFATAFVLPLRKEDPGAV